MILLRTLHRDIARYNQLDNEVCCCMCSRDFFNVWFFGLDPFSVRETSLLEFVIRAVRLMNA